MFYFLGNFECASKSENRLINFGNQNFRLCSNRYFLLVWTAVSHGMLNVIQQKKSSNCVGKEISCLLKIGMRTRRQTLKIVLLGMFLLLLFLLGPANYAKVLNDCQSPTVSIPDKQYLQHLVEEARNKAKCVKPANSKEYVICEDLPFTEIKCGECESCPASSQSTLKFRIPNVVHFIWFGKALKLTSFLHYLAVRSIASIQRPEKIFIHLDVETVHTSELLNRLLNEIPCIHLRTYKAPDQIFDKKIEENMFKSDIARLEILLKYGGIYVDLDAMNLNPLNDLRVHGAVIGRSSTTEACNGIILSEPNSAFIDTWLKSYQMYDPNTGRGLEYWGLTVPYSIYLQHKEEGFVHVDEVLINRPNPFVDSLNSTTFGHYSIKENYFLHVHPREVKSKMAKFDLDSWREEKLRTLDSTYGQAARIALFGSSDLVFLKSEKAHEPIYSNLAKVISSPET